MTNYDLSSPRAIADAAEEVEKERLRLHEVGFQTGKYDKHETAFLYAYGQALKDCAKQLEPLQGLIDDVLNYLGEHFDSSELRRMFFEDMGMSEEDVALLGFDLGLELDGEIANTSAVAYVHDFGNGYKVQRVYANQMRDGSYGDIYDLQEDCKRDHPNGQILMGYCVVDVVDGVVPLGCNDWNNLLSEAILDYEENVVPNLEVWDIVVDSWADMQRKYPMDRDEMTEEEEAAFVEDCFKLYEQEGFSPRYWSPFTDNVERVGLPIEIVGRVEEDEAHDFECLPMWKARLDGCEFEVFPEEVIPSEMKANGCHWFDIVLEYDRTANERLAGLPVDVMTPQEMADNLGHAVRDGNEYYLPKDIVPGVDGIIRNAEDRAVVSAPDGNLRDIELD